MASTGSSYNRKIARLFVVAAGLSIVLASFATLAVSNVMPVVVAELNGVPLYTLAFGIPLTGQLIATAISGPWCDARGPHVPIALGVMLFAGGLGISGIAPNMIVFILGRAVMGLGAGFLMVSMYVLVGCLVPPEDRPKVFAVLAAAWALPSAIGPWLAGKIVEMSSSWRMVFLIIIPCIMALSVFFVPLLRYVPPMKNPPAAGSVRLASAAIIAGLGVAVILITSVVPSIYSKLFLLLGLVAVVLAVPRMFPRGTFRLRTGLPAMMASRGTANAAFVATESFLPLMLQKGRGLSPADAGLILAAGSITYALGSVAQGRIRKRHLRQMLPWLGGTFLAIGVVVSAMGAFQTIPVGVMVVGWCITGMGLGLTYPALASAALETVPESRHGLASATLQLADTLGSSAALAAITYIFSAVAMLPGPLPYLPGPAIALLLATLATISGFRCFPGSGIGGRNLK